MIPRATLLLSFLAAGLPLAAPAAAQQPPANVQDLLDASRRTTKDAEALISSCAAFAARLRDRVGEGQGPVSPGSVIAVLHLLQACTDEASAQQVREVLGLPAALRGERLSAAIAEVMPRAGDQTVKTTNTVWLDNGFALPPTAVLERAHLLGAQVQAMDFAADPARARRFINYQIATATNGRIPELLDPGSVTGETSLVLTNTFWFKDAWAHSFPAADTKARPFTLRSGEVVDAPTMFACATFDYAETDAAQIVRLPFERSSMVFEVVLPKPGVTLAAARDAAQTAAFRPLGRRKVELYLPRFRAGARHDLTSALFALGLPRDLVATAGLMPAGKEDLQITQAVQQTWIDIHERGAEAAAATAMMMRCGSRLPPEPPTRVTMRCDRPFSFSLRDGRNGLVWMSGELLDPRSAAQ